MRYPYKIKDKTVFKAVSFARKMKSEGMAIGLAIYKAAKYYKVSQRDVAQEMGKLANAYKQANAAYSDYSSEFDD
jgi:hypothetical protein